MSRAAKASDDLAAQLLAVVDWLDKPATLEPQTVADLLKGTASGLSTFSREIIKLNVDMAISNSKPPHKAAQPSAYGSRGARPGFKRRLATTGTASQVSFGSQARSVSVPMGGFADEEEKSPSTPVQSTYTSATPVTPSSARPPASIVAGSSVVMGCYGLLWEALQMRTVPENLRLYVRLVSAYIEENGGRLAYVWVDKFNDAANGKPAEERIMAIANILRDMVSGDPRSVARVLGYESESADRDSKLGFALAPMLK
ncbi:hypothetical protein ColTof4_14386 [Colletotrichum tofieldiae]|nr:hypothetical protein ColTof3_14799 [Colletotrichum tofieldiae]GKT81963.1 hypothetical protein ColTof4_14386 [Colletotrichum tofieldiae]